MLVVAAENCPHEAAQRADRLTEEPSRSGIAVVRTHNASFSLNEPDSDSLERINAVMNGPLPVVFVRGPTLRWRSAGLARRLGRQEPSNMSRSSARAPGKWADWARRPGTTLTIASFKQFLSALLRCTSDEQADNNLLEKAPLQ